MNNLEQLLSAWTPVQESFRSLSRGESAMETLVQELSAFSDVSRINDRDELARGSQQLSRLVDVAGTCGDASVFQEIMEFVENNLQELGFCIGEEQPHSKIDSMIELSNEAWADYFGSDNDFGMDNDPWQGDFELGFGETSEEDADDTPVNDIEQMLAALSTITTSVEETPAEEVAVAEEAEEEEIETQEETIANDEETVSVDEEIFADSEEVPAAEEQTDATDVDESSELAARQELQSDPEMLDAYLDDSTRCVELMEASALALDADAGDKDSIRAFCRELHTLKGASATVGLTGLASHLHRLETSLEESFADDTNANPEKLFEAIDFVRSEMDGLRTGQSQLSEDVEAAETETADTTESPQQPTESEPQSNAFSVTNARVITPVTATKRVSKAPSNENSSIRIRAKQLDRLMDMLAELVVLRNDRENNASEFDLLYGELSRCSTRLTMVEEQSGTLTNASLVGEVSKDIDAVARGFRALQKPVANDNAAISRFIRDFRQELMHLRRVPMSGLFGRLQRAARDAAKTEDKQVRVNFIGENTGLEQEIQERLFESLLHVVRNSVSHGIQSPQQRSAAGKDETGTITLAASSSAQSLVIEVRDDGNGVDYEAVRRRGIEKGLIAPNQNVTNNELASLIFHPGFSTRETASEVSGRGIGMDVVATTLEQMHGRIEVESSAGLGTTMRLLIPRRTGIEHVMVFRSHDQLYALPMQSIVAVKKSRKGFDSLYQLNFSRTSKQRADSVIIFKSSGLGQNAADSQMAIAVEELLGPEEVVVRSLPPMICNHPLFSGVTLSGSGEKVLLLESENVPTYCIAESEQQTRHVDKLPSSGSKRRALVVDDSITARKHLSKLLKEHGFVVAEAGDGLEAIETLHRSSFDLIVTDLDMPRLGGLELLADIRNGKYSTAPVIVVSSRDDNSFKRQAIEYGAKHYINKPVSKQQLQQRLKELEIN